MPSPKAARPKVRSRMAGVRLREEEWTAFQQFAGQLDETPSRIIRRLIREAITGGPDYFDDGLLELRRMRTALNAVGRNLNQLTKAANQGQAVEDAALRRVINAVRVQVAAVEALYRRAELAGVSRAVMPRPAAGGQPAPPEDAAG